jgi:transcriptional regulator GlxA family with amidase domain
MSEASKPTVGILLFDGVEVLDFGGPFEVFSGVHKIGDDQSLFHVVTIAEEDRIITSAGGLLVKPHATITQHPPLEILIVPGGDVGAVATNPRVLEWVVQQDQQTRLTASVCTGAFVLANAGLLNGHRATTHWGSIERMRERYPAVEVLAETRFVDEGRLLTSAGISAGIDMSLHIVSRLYGEEVAAQTAHEMEYRWSAPGKS